jgi:hypothetical protein
LSDSNASLGAGQYLNYVATISQKVTKYSKKFCGQRVADRSVARHELPQGSAQKCIGFESIRGNLFTKMRNRKAREKQ